MAYQSIEYLFEYTNGFGDMITDFSGSFVCGIRGSKVYTSNDAGDNWTLTSTLPYGISKMPYRYFSDSYANQIIVNRDIGYFLSADKGANWAQTLITFPPELGTIDYLTCPTVIDSGNNLVTVVKPFLMPRTIIVSHDAGGTWTVSNAGGTLVDIRNLASSSVGDKIYVTYANKIYGSTDSGVNFSLLHTFSNNIKDLSLNCSGDGKVLTLLTSSNEFFISYDDGSTWNDKIYTGFGILQPASLSYDGQVITCYGIDNVYGTGIYMSLDGAISWNLVVKQIITRINTATNYFSPSYHCPSGNGLRAYTQLLSNFSIYRWFFTWARSGNNKVIWWN